MMFLSVYRVALQCKHCKRVYGEYSCAVYKLSSWGRSVCPNCGEIDELRTVVARPRLFGLLGYEVKEQK